MSTFPLAISSFFPLAEPVVVFVKTIQKRIPSDSRTGSFFAKSGAPLRISQSEALQIYRRVRSRSQLGSVCALALDTTPIAANRVMMEEPP